MYGKFPPSDSHPCYARKIKRIKNFLLTSKWHTTGEDFIADLIEDIIVEDIEDIKKIT